LEIPATEAKNHIHEIATVHGKLKHVQAIPVGRYGLGAWLDVDGNYPHQSFNIVQFNCDNASFLRLKKFEGKEISVTGEIGTNYTSGQPGLPMSRLPGMIINSVDEISMRGQTETDEIITPAAPVKQEKNPFNRFDSPNAQTNQSTSGSRQEKIPTWNDADATNTIVTVLGHVYHHAKITLVEPDGVTIKYTPDGGGFGGIKIPFGDLPLEYQQQYGYDPQQAAAYGEAQKKAAIQAQAQKQTQEEQQKQAEAKQAQLDYEQAKEDYQRVKEEFDVKIKIQTLQAQQQIADAQSKAAQQAALQTRIMRAAAIENQIQQQQQLWEMQSQTYQQQRIANQINDLNWQLRMLMLNR
jgi:hypothetical protein